jgi:hypothetical protein
MFRQALALLATGLAVSSDALAQPRLEAKAGDDVPLRLSRPLVVNSVTLLGEGEVLHGKVTRIKRSGPRGRNGEVNWNATVGVVILKDHHVSY